MPARPTMAPSNSRRHSNQASGKAIKVVTATTITWRLKALLDAPVQLEGGVFVLRYLADHNLGTFTVREVAVGGKLKTLGNLGILGNLTAIFARACLFSGDLRLDRSKTAYA